MKKQITILLFSLLTMIIKAQNDTINIWTTGHTFSLNFSQVSLTNWSAGGNNSVAGNGLYKGFLNKKWEHFDWNTTLDLNYGLTKQGDYDWAKSEDRFVFTTKLGYKATEHVFYAAMADFKSQFTMGYSDPLEKEVIISDFMAPAYLVSSIGIDYKPSNELSVYTSPLSSKLTFVLNDSLSAAGSYGVEKGQKVREEYGASMKVLVKKDDLIKGVSCYSRLDLFTNYREKPKNVDVDFEAGLTLKANKYLSALVTVNLLYDDDIKYIDEGGNKRGARLQVRQMIGVGLTYTL